MISQTYISAPVTALSYFQRAENGVNQQLLLVGEGSILKIYDPASSNLIGCSKIFASQDVHGIVVRVGENDTRASIAVWGGRSFAFLSGKDLESILSGEAQTFVSKETFAPDWILDAAFGPSSTDDSCVFITAHNEVLQVPCTQKQGAPEMKVLSSASRSILYSAHITWISDTSIMVAAGTVFGEIEIIVWPMNSVDKTESGTILSTFTGHEGSIFGVQISPKLQNANGESVRMLASCSDDRTIRLWDLSTLDLSRPALEEISKPSMRETGFGAREGAESITSGSENRCIAKVMGHASRIWKVRFVLDEVKQPRKETPFNILSFGEDATVQQWDLEGWSGEVIASEDAEKVGARAKITPTLSHIETYAHHTGKHIWSTALLEVGDGSTMVATGGADGAIATFDVKVQRPMPNQSVDAIDNASSQKHFRSSIFTPAQILEQFGGYIEEPPAQDIVAEAPDSAPRDPDENGTPATQEKKKKKAKKLPVARKDAFNKYAYVDGSRLLFTTTFGKVVVQSAHNTAEWNEVPLPAGCETALRSYSVVASLSNKGAVLAGATGKIFMYSTESGMKEVANLQSKVAALFELPGYSGGSSSILATTLGQPHAIIMTLNTIDQRNKTQATLELPASFVVTSAAIIDKFLVLGCRSGKIAMYDTAVSTTSLQLTIDKSFVCHDAITCIVRVPKSEDGLPRFVVTARNGKYAIFALHKGSGRHAKILELLHYSMLPFGPMIEGAAFVGKSLIIYGFRSQNFIAWDETKQREVMSVKCGGAHRNYAYTTASEGNEATTFAYTKASELCIHQQLEPGFQIVKEGGHGREIKASAVSEDQQLIATAAEDTNIRIWSYAEQHDPLLNNLECHAVLRKHSAGIQHLQWAETGGKSKYLFSAGGVEEFCVWAVSWIPGFGLGVVCEATLEDLSEEKDLRIMSFHAVAVGGDEGVDPTYMIVIAFSDSTIRAYWYDRSNGFEKLATGRYTSSCLTQIQVLPMPTGETMVLTGSTDGHLVLWQIGDDDEDNTEVELVMTERVKVHQSGILSFDIMPIGPSDFIVATGGDDNAAALTCLGLSGFGVRTIMPDAHAAAVTGVTFVAHSHNTAENAGTFRFCTVGGDQKVKKWTVAVTAHMDEAGLIIENMAWNDMEDEDEVPTTVSDAAGVVTFGGRCSHKHCMVFGNGIDVFEV